MPDDEWRGTVETVTVDESQDPVPSEAVPESADDCWHCSGAINDKLYMVTAALWEEAAHLPSNAFCHRRCLERRIGRRLVRSDYTDAPINDWILGTTRTFVWTRGLWDEVNYRIPPDSGPLWWPTDPAAVGLTVRALRDLDPEGADVKAGDFGAVKFPANHYNDATGPMVAWVKGGHCNVYPGDVESVP